MDETPARPATRAPEHLRWDVEASQSHECTLATARATPNEVVLAFGGRQPRGAGPGEVGPDLALRIALSPLTAKNLAATLRRLIEDSGAR